MRSHSWILAAATTAFLPACSSSPTTDSNIAQVESTQVLLDKSAGRAGFFAQLPEFARAPHRHEDAQRLATGQYVTPTALLGAVQQFLNPGLPAYPNFVAGEAVRSQLSPDRTTLAVLCAGQNSLIKPDGTTDVEA